jgi:hypothetical protein
MTLPATDTLLLTSETVALKLATQVSCSQKVDKKCHSVNPTSSLALSIIYFLEYM